jgi:superfamily II DNA or RNA helicase
MKTCQLKILDEVNVKFEGLDPVTRRKIVNKLKFTVPYAFHLPSFKMGRWDGTVSFATIGGSTYLNLLDQLLPIVQDAGYEIELDDRRTEFDLQFEKIDQSVFANRVWPKGHPAEGEPIILRDYQVEVINKFLDNPQSIQEVATGAGKTLITAALSYFCEPYGRTIVIVPNKQLVEQTESDYKNLGLDVGVFYGNRKEYNRTHTIATWQSLSIFSKKSKKSQSNKDEESICEWLSDVVCVIVDESHSAKGTELKTLLTGPFSRVPVRWGLTGTVPKEDFDAFHLYVSIGPVVSRLAAKELQDAGILANLDIEVIQLKENRAFKSWQDESAYLNKEKSRLDWVAKKIVEVSKTGNTLVLFNNIETGKYLQSQIPDSVFISGAVDTTVRREHYDNINETNNNVILATSGVAAVGINVPRIYNLFLFEPGKSFVRTIQSIGRGIRRAKDKDYLKVYDICATTKYSSRHLAARKKYYKDAQYTFKITKVDW